MRSEVVHFLCLPGTGKSHLAIALGVEAVKAGPSVYFCTTAAVVCSVAALAASASTVVAIWVG